MYHICFCADENYIKFAAVMMHNILNKTNAKQYEKKPYIFHILTDKIENQTRQKLNQLEKILNLKYPCEIKIHKISDKDFQNKSKWKGSLVPNFILKFDEVLSDEVDKALCLDLDMFVFADLRELFEFNLDDNVALVVSDDCLDNKKYFNSGLVLFNVKEYKRLNLKKQALEYLSTYNPTFPDQDSLNAVIKDKKILLPKIWNFHPANKNLMWDFFKDESEQPECFLTREEYQTLLKEVKIIHFLNCPKPWQPKFTLIRGKIRLSLFRALWWENALKTPIFQEELFEIHQKLKENEVEEFALALEISQYGGALKLFKNQIEYRLGYAMIKHSKIKRNIPKLPFILIYIIFKYKISKIIYNLLSFYHPRFRAYAPELILKIYENDKNILKAKEHLSYRLGVALIKAHKTWYKGGYIKFFKEIRDIKKDFNQKRIHLGKLS